MRRPSTSGGQAAKLLPASHVTIAVVGASRDRFKTAHSVPAQMQRHGWRIIPVNPYADQIFGERAYRRLADLPEPVDLVNVFRPSADATAVVREAIAIGAPAVWLQLDIVSPEGRRLAEKAGIDYVEDTCIAVVRALSRLSRATDRG
jgi:predicted CoA-binding protein